MMIKKIFKKRVLKKSEVLYLYVTEILMLVKPCVRYFYFSFTVFSYMFCKPIWIDRIIMTCLICLNI